MAQTINVDVTPSLFQPTLYYHQGDIGREFAINISTKDGYQIPSGATAKIEATKPSGFGFSVDGTLSGSVVSFVSTEGMTDEWGRFPAQLKISSGNTVVYTANFLMVGEKDTHPASTVDGTQEDVIPQLTLLVERVENAAAAVLDTTTEVTTLPAGSQATYSFDEETNTATFGIPQGEAGAGSAGVVASAYSASKTYAVGDYAIHNSNLYRCTTAIATAESFTAAHWTQVVLADDVTDLKDEITDLADIDFMRLSGEVLPYTTFYNNSGTYVLADTHSWGAGSEAYTVLMCKIENGQEYRLSAEKACRYGFANSSYSAELEVHDVTQVNANSSITFTNDANYSYMYMQNSSSNGNIKPVLASTTALKETIENIKEKIFDVSLTKYSFGSCPQNFLYVTNEIFEAGKTYHIKASSSSSRAGQVVIGCCDSSNQNATDLWKSAVQGFGISEITMPSANTDKLYVWTQSWDDYGKDLDIILCEKTSANATLFKSAIKNNRITQYIMPRYATTATTVNQSVYLKKDVQYLITVEQSTSSGGTFEITDANSDSVISKIIKSNSGYYELGWLFKVSVEGDANVGLWTDKNTTTSIRIKEVPAIEDSTCYVAASNSSEADKAKATFVCDGAYDELTINSAIRNLGGKGTVKLLAGDYYVDQFYTWSDYKKSAIVIDGNSENVGVAIKGIMHYHNCSNIHVRASAFTGLGSSDQVCVINVLAQNGYLWRVDIQDLAIVTETWEHPHIIINLDHCGCGEIKNLKLSTFGDYSLQHVENYPDGFVVTDPVEGVVGIRSFCGWTYGDTVRMDNISVWGCRVAFQLGGEHLIANNLRARWNYCGYTFGEYHDEVSFGCFDHPITLINCCDEKSYKGPIFDYCGLLTDQYDSANDKKLQSITFIDFNTEQFAVLATETTPGSFCGIVYYHPSDGVYGASVTDKFWADGHGHNFRTVNLAHAKGGTSALRNTYTPNYMQEFFDTTLNKMLVYNGTAWVDMNGNEV